MNKKLILLAVPLALAFGGCQSYTKPPMAVKHTMYTDIPDEEKILIDVKSLYRMDELKASGMRFWRL